MMNPLHGQQYYSKDFEIICIVSLSKENNIMPFGTWQKQYAQGCQK